MQLREIDRAGRARDAWSRALRASPLLAWRVSRLATLSVLHAALGVLQQVAEIAAPCLLLAGGLWWALPRALAGFVARDPGAGDAIAQATGQIPRTLDLAGWTLTPDGLLRDGVAAILVAAASHTAMTVIAALFFRDRD